MKILAPSRSQRNLSLGLFKADSLGSLQDQSKKIDMSAAKAGIRLQRRILSGEYERTAAKADQMKKKLRAAKAWWRRRRFWRSVKVGKRLGKVVPAYSGYPCWVEFPDRSQAWVRLKDVVS